VYFSFYTPKDIDNDVDILTDIDECALKTDECEQECENVIGRYNCHCFTGFTLNQDRRTCTTFVNSIGKKYCISNKS